MFVDTQTKHNPGYRVRMIPGIEYEKPRVAPLRTRFTSCFPRSCLVPGSKQQTPSYRYAIGRTWLLVAAPEEKYVDFVDSRGLFSCRIPAEFLRAERAKDKKGTVFVSGNYNKAEVLSVQLLTAYDLLKDAGEVRCFSTFLR